jgi:hypothetical protein
MVGKRAGRWVISGNDIIDYTIVNFGTFFSLGQSTKNTYLCYAVFRATLSPHEAQFECAWGQGGRL